MTNTQNKQSWLKARKLFLECIKKIDDATVRRTSNPPKWWSEMKSIQFELEDRTHYRTFKAE